MERERERWLTSAGGVLAAWLALIVLENAVIGVGYRALFAGSWEMAVARTRVSPIALAALTPIALASPIALALVARAESSARARRLVAVTFGALGAAEGYGVTFGRHFASWTMRAPFIALVALAGAVVAGSLAPRIARAARERPRAVAVVAAVVAAVAWCADAFALVRLYPAFHAALFAIALGAAAFAALAWRGAPAERAIAWTTLTFGVGCAAWAPLAAERLHSADNLRKVLVEHAPVLGRAVRLAAWMSPPPEDDSPSGDAPRAGPPRALDWTGRDVLVVSIDALRADHVGAYGYARATTPNLDRLAREGALFVSAYCPTPHTSYSITSMMTGKYMRPLLTLGVGQDSETWASYARRYGYKTAAFYPPAVFFIDEPKFGAFEARGLDFEYRKVEFAAPELRARQVEDYVTRAPADSPLFVWVHLFEPHEPYVMHPEHPFGAKDGFTDLDAYDSEIAAADAGLGAIVDAFRKKRPGAVVIATADHGEEFGEHGGRYHGTTVYEEQVRVPLVIVGPGVSPRKIGAPVQTIDLLPTTLSALGVPRPARVLGRDLGPALAGKGEADRGLAFAETDDYTLLAQGDDRLVCARKAAACALYDVAADPREARDGSTERPEIARGLRKRTRAIEREAAKYEAGEGADLPEALRRGLAGDADAADDVAALLGDAKVELRRRAAEVLFRLRAKSTEPALARALAEDEDEVVKRHCAVALERIAGKPNELAAALIGDPDVAWRRRAALAFADAGDPRGQGELVAYWSAEAPPAAGLGFEDARELLAAIVKARAKDAAPALVRSLGDVRLRPDLADALGALGDPRARPALLEAFRRERFVSARPREARALVALGARDELFAPLQRFAGVPQPMHDAIAIAKSALLLVPARGGLAPAAPASAVDVALTVTPGPSRLLVLTRGERPPRAQANGESLQFTNDRDLFVADLVAAGREVKVHLEDDAGVLGVWLVPRAEELPPPPATPWDAGADEPR